MATHKSSEPNASTPQEPSMPIPQALPTVPEAGAMSADARGRRVLRSFAKLCRGMANTSPGRNDSLGPLWHELACDLEAQCKEAGIVDEAPPATPERPLELRPLPAQTMLHGPSGTDPVQMQILAALEKLAARIG